MSDDSLLKIAEAIREISKVEKRIHARMLAVEDALKRLGVTQEFLTERYNHHLIERQVRDEGLLGPKEVTDLWRDEDDQGIDPDLPRET